MPGEPVEAGIAPIKDVIIDLQPEPYKYSVVLDTDRNIIRKFRGIGLIVMEVSVKVVAGRIGILWADENYQPLAATEHYVSAMPSVQRVLISAPFMQAHHLVIRNVADGSTGSTFKVTKASAKVVGDTVQEDGADKPDAEAIHMRALMTARAGDLNLAARLFADASALDPDNADALAGQGEMLDMTGQGAIALSKYETSRSLRAAGRGGAPDRTFALRRRGRSTTEIAAYTSVLHPEKPRALAYIARGNAFLAEGRADRALADYETAFQLKPAAPEISALKGEALAMLGCYMEALEAFDEAIAARPQDFEAMGGRAIAHLALGNLDAADADWRRQFELIPAAQTAARACVALRLADYENALAELDRTLAKEPANPYWRLYRLTALHRLGQPPGEIGEIGNNWPNRLLALHAGKLTAEQVLARADNDDRRNEALFQLAVLAASRDPGEARRLWAEVVAQARPDLIEHAAARHELARLGA